MKVQKMAIGMELRHPDYGVGRVVALGEQSADLCFADGVKSINPEFTELHPIQATAALSGLEMPLSELIEQIAQQMQEQAQSLEADQEVEELGPRWHGGSLMLKPAKEQLQAKEMPLEVFFHKIVGIRNQLRVLEQKINANGLLNSADKVELQQYVSRCYGSLTSFNVLFKDKASQFSSRVD